MIQFLSPYEFSRDPTIFIDDHTVTYQRMCGYPNKQHQKELASAIADYAKANKIERRLLPQFDLANSYELVPVDNTSVTVWVDFVEYRV